VASDVRVSLEKDWAGATNRGDPLAFAVRSWDSLGGTHTHPDWQRYYQTTFRNVFTDQPLRLENSPGNFVFRASTNGVELVWHDYDGAEAYREVIGLW
jgi:hypothetical protein